MSTTIGGIQIGSIGHEGIRMKSRLDFVVLPSTKVSIKRRSMIAKRKFWNHLAEIFGIACIFCSALVLAQPENTSTAPHAHQTPADSPAAAERAPKGQLQTIFGEIDVELKQTDDNLLLQSPQLAKLLLSIQREASRIPQFSRNPVLQSIEVLKKQLGRSLQPRQVSDFVEMYQPIMNLRSRCNPTSRQNLQASNSQDCAIVQFFPAGWWETFRAAGNSLQLQESKRGEINGVKDKILDIECALDSENWNEAARLYGQMISDKFTAQFAPAQRYLEATQTLQNDLYAYGEASKVDRAGDHSLTRQIDIVAKEAALLRKSREKPIATAQLQKNLAEDDAELKLSIAAVQALPLDEQTFALPTALKTTTLTNGAEKVSFLQSRLAMVNSKIAKSEIQALEDGADVVTFTLIKEQVGSASWMTLKTRAIELSAAEALRDRLATSLKETQAIIQQEEDAKAQSDAKRPALEVYVAELKAIRGNRYRVRQGLGMEIFQHILNQIPHSQYVDRVSLYKSMEGLDGTTTLEALARDRKLYIGKYYVLQGDVFKIQADRDYPREGLNQFSAFGQVDLVGDYFVPVNVDCISAEKVPPYSIAPILGRIIGFRLGRNGAGKSIIIPVMQVVAVASPSQCCGYPEEIIINQ
jgi:hypothetical protein